MEMEANHNMLLVTLSYCVSVFGSYTGLQLAGGIKDASPTTRPWWIFFSALALGGGAIWAMHFIGMIAYEMSMPVAYDIGLTVFSLVIAVLFVGVGISIIALGKMSMFRLMVAGVISGLGVASMHYIGMEAVIVAADMHYDTVLYCLSFIIAIGATTAALWLSFNLTGNLQKIGSAFVMAIAVCGMHYTGMAGMSMTHNNNTVDLSSSMEPLTMGLFIFCFSMLLLVLCLIVALSQLNKRMYEQMEAEYDS